MTAPVRIGPSLAVSAPPATPPASGLTSLARHPDTGNVRWELGYSYRPELPAGVVRNRSIATATLGANVGDASWSDIIETIPVLLEVEDEISTFSGTSEDLEARARRLLESYTTKLLERELWMGEIAAVDGLPNRRLASADATNITPAGGAVEPQVAVARLMGALADAGMGDGMIHASKSVGIRLPDGWRNEQTYEDHGFVVVAGTGYPGTGPDGTGTGWMYATEIVNVRLGDIEVVPGELREAITRPENTITYRAQRVGAVDFAGPVFACQVIET